MERLTRTASNYVSVRGCLSLDFKYKTAKVERQEPTDNAAG